MADTSNDMFGGEGLWIFALLILLFGGGFGYGNGNQLTENTLERAIDLNAVQQGQSSIENRVIEVGAENISAIKDASYNNLTESRDISQALATGFANQQSCCCETNRNIDSVRFDMANYSAQIQANDTANTQKVLDAIAQSKIDALTQKVSELELANATSNVVKYPTATTYAMSNPFCNCGCSAI